MTKKLAVLFAVTAGLAVGNLYWAQPLLAEIAADFGAPTHRGGYLIMATQAGYAAGILLIVPLGDILRRRRLIPAAMLCSAAALVGCSAAPSFGLLLAALLLMGIVTVSGQIIVPLTGDLAGPQQRGHLVGIVVSGITTGILAARVFGGLIAALWGWRTVYLIAAALNLLMAAVIYRKLPDIAPKERISYGRLIRDVFTAFVRYPVLPRILIPSGLVVGVGGTLFWNAMTFLLSDAPYNFSTFQIGLVSIVTLAGALGGMGLGKFQDKGLGGPALGALIILAILSLVLALFSGRSLIGLAASGFLISLAIQGVVILSQTRIFMLNANERSRLNTVFIFSNFVFSAAGSFLTTALWKAGGWTAVSLAGIAVSALALLVWLISVRTFAEMDAEASD